MILTKRKTVLIFAGFGMALCCGASNDHSPQSILQDLRDGNKRFASGQATHCHLNDQSLVARQMTQAPGAIILSCSDSRVPPERIFDRDFGELFTVRVAGNVLNDDVIASIEYAVMNFGSRLIIIMGHDSCGAIKAAVGKRTDEDIGSPNLNHLIQEIRDNLGKFTSADPTFRDAAKKNVSAVAADLTKRSKIVRDAAQSGKLRIVQSIYSLGNGQVEFWD